MNKVLLLAAAALFASCTQNLNVEVKNPTDTLRKVETIELDWEKVSTISGIQPENVIVLDKDQKQIPSQVVYMGEKEPQMLVFQALNTEAGASQQFQITKGEREEYANPIFARVVPERYDDFAWENNRIAYRTYGPALETSVEKLITSGMDIWLKSVEYPVIDIRYKNGDYHHDHGNGMDCYKTGRTLGAGACVPFLDGELKMMTHNYKTAEVLDMGPVRLVARLTFVPYEVNGVEVSFTKYLTLDANQHFNKFDCIYTGDFKELPIAAGYVRHTIKDFAQDKNWFALREAASDTKTPEEDGDIYAGLILPGAEIMADTVGHALAVKNCQPGVALTYYNGAGWSKGGEINGIRDIEHWTELVKQCEASAVAPLTVEVK